MPYDRVLLLGTGLFLTIRSGSPSFAVSARRCARCSAASRRAPRGALTPFQAFMTALAASIGTGNIAGVATAIISGGPGALFWIWCYGFVAMAIKFTEAVLGIVPRHATATACSSGPMYYLRDGLARRRSLDLRARRRRRRAHDHAVHPAQLDRRRPARPRSASRRSYSGLVLAVLTWLVIIGGITSIGRAPKAVAAEGRRSTSPAAWW